MKTFRSNRRGIALVIVLAMVTLLVALAISLTGNTRFDRVSGSNHLEATKARSLVPMALIDFFDNITYAYPSFATTNGWSVYPSSEILKGRGYSGDPGGAISGYDALKFAGTEAQAFITPANIGAYRTATNNLEWVYIQNPEPDGNTPARFIARYAAIAQNESGMLDFNAAFSNANARVAIPRRAYEIDLSDALSPVSLTTAAANRNTVSSRRGRYETLPDLTYNAFWNGTPVSNNNFTVISRYVDKGGVLDRATNPAGGVDNVLPLILTNVVTRKSEIIPRLALATLIPLGQKVYPSQALTCLDQLYNSMVDYWDTDREPQDLLASVENVPMINEVVVESRVVENNPDSSGKAMKIEVTAWVELFFPFVGPASPAGKDNGVGRGRPDIDFSVGFGAGTPHSMVINPGSDDVFDATRRYRVYKSNTVMMQGSLASAANVDVTLTINKMRVLSGYQTSSSNTEVDRVVVGTPPPNLGTIADSVGSVKVLQLEAFDPRFNYTLDPGACLTAPSGVAVSPWKQTFVATTNETTLGRFNKYPNDEIVKAANAGFFDDNNATACRAYVGNATNFVSAAELGCLAYHPWRTIRLLSPSAAYPVHTVLDHFDVVKTGLDLYGTGYTGTGTNTYRRGLVNVNTRQQKVAAAPFVNLVYGTYPGENLGTISAANANALASGIVGWTTPRLSRSLFYNSPAMYTALSGIVGSGGELARENTVLGSCEILGVRNNLFTVMLTVQSLRLDRGADGAVNTADDVYRPVGTERVVAQVWRDVVPSQYDSRNPGASPKYPLQVLFVKNLYD